MGISKIKKLIIYIAGGLLLILGTYYIIRSNSGEGPETGRSTRTIGEVVDSLDGV